MEDSETELSNRLVFRQNNLLEEQDFVQPPPAYSLLGLKLSTNLILPTYKIRCFVKADNLLNISYRDYLNRQRYFADDIGLSITVGVNVKFWLDGDATSRSFKLKIFFSKLATIN